MSQLWNSSWLYFPKLPYILQAYQHTCLQRNEAGERVSSRMVGIGKSVLFSTSTSKAFWMESNNCSMSLLVSPRLPCSCSPLAALELYVNKTTITAIKLLILRSFQRKGLCNSGLKAKSITFVNNIKTEYNGRKQYNSR